MHLAIGAHGLAVFVNENGGVVEDIGVDHIFFWETVDDVDPVLCSKSTNAADAFAISCCFCQSLELLYRTLVAGGG